MNTKILILGGGNSPEREVSLRSAKAVADAANIAGLEVDEKDPAHGVDFLDDLEKDTIIFPILHGAGGEDGTIQAELEKRQLPYLGSSSKSSRVCFNKSRAREELAKSGLPVAKGGAVTINDYYAHPLCKQPHVLKVQRGGSSIGTYIVRDPAQIDRAKVSEVFKLDKNAVIEELIEGVEITVPILDAKALLAIEIQPPEDQEFDYENKYNGKTLEHCPPVNISEEVQTAAQDLAEKVHNALGCRHLSRVDIIIRPDNSMIVLELNTIPGLTGQSLYPKAATASGIDMPSLVNRFADLVKRDYRLD